jgi:hypothetical protein
LPFGFRDLSTSTTIKLHIAVSSGTLNLDDIGIVVGYPDATNPTLLKFKASYPTMGTKPLIPDRLNVASAMTAGSEPWTGTISNKYELSVTISDGHANPALAPVIFLWTFKELTSQVLYADSELVYS